MEKLFFLGLLVAATLATNSALRADDGPSSPGSPAVSSLGLRVPLDALEEAFVGSVVSVQADGIVQIGAKQLLTEKDFLAWWGKERPYGPDRVILPPSEGYYVGLVYRHGSNTPVGGRLFRVRLLEIRDRFAIRAQLGPAAAKQIEAGETIRLIRPLLLTTAEMQRIPDSAVIVETKQADHERKMRVARNRMKNIVLAMHNYHDLNHSFPPAFVVGPDAKPWHSWRMLLLPFLNQKPLYDKYHFDEPWNGPHNIKLLDEMPDIYSEPLYGEGHKGCTPYVAIVGEKAAFSPTGGKFGDQQSYRGRILGLRAIEGGRPISEFKDGVSNTVLLGTVGPNRKIPWLKPEDLVFDGKLLPLGSPGSLATPFESDPNDPEGIFGMADGSSQLFRRSFDTKLFQTLLTINGRDTPSGGYRARAAQHESKPSTPRHRVPVVEFETTKDGVRGNYKFEDVDLRMLVPELVPR
jgi:hypothetical protein